MFRRLQSIVFILLFFHIEASSQTVADFWYFGDQAAIRFSDDSIQTLLDSESNNDEGGSSLSNMDGELLFYTQQFVMRNRAHQMMPNAFLTLGSSTPIQSPLALQYPNNPDRFVIFTLFGILQSELEYAIVDMTLDNGLGDLTSTQNFLTDSLSERMTAYPKCDGTGFWLLTRAAMGTQYHVFSLGSTGVSSVPVSSSGVVEPGISGVPTGEMTISPDGSKVVSAHLWDSKLEFLSFDSYTGLLTNAFEIELDSGLYPYGAEISPNSELLYIACRPITINPTSGQLLQFDLTSFDSSSVHSSIQIIADSNYLMNSIQTGPDFKLYIAADDTFLHVIHEPNQAGLACNLEFAGIDLQGRSSRQGLPQFNYTFLQNYFGERVLCPGDTGYFNFNDSCHISLEWNFDDPASGASNTSNLNNPSHVFSDTGVYNVSLTVNYDSASRNYSGEIRVVPDNLPDVLPDTLDACDSTLSIDISLVDYLWSVGATTPSIHIDTTGWYSVTVSSPCDTVTDSVFVRSFVSPVVSLPPDTSLCGSQTFVVNAQLNTASDFSWSTGQQSLQITVDSTLTGGADPFLISASATNDCGTSADSMLIDFLPLPNANLPPDTTQCFAGPVILTFDAQDSTSYLWSDSSSATTFRVDTNQTVWLQANNVCGSVSDTVVVKFQPEITSELGEDTLLCPGDSIILNARWSGATYQWNASVPADQQNDSIIGVSYDQLEQNGTSQAVYLVTITDRDCQKVESITLRLDDQQCDSSVCKFSIPNVFSPNGDGINDQLSIVLTCAQRSFEVDIYNRWGQLIYRNQSQGRPIQWDGYLNGTKASAGTYFIKAEDNQGQQQMTTVTIVE